jgi:ABC-type molybdate transport system ATPase subunit
MRMTKVLILSMISELIKFEKSNQKIKDESMFDKDTINDKAIQKDKKLFVYHDKDLFPLLTGRSSSDMSVPCSYPFIVDWQMSENENKIESTQIQ